MILRRLFTSALELLAFLTALIFPGPLRTCPLHTAGTARRRFLAADHFCRDRTLFRVLFFGPWRHRMTKRRSRLNIVEFNPSLKSSFRTTAASLSSGFAIKSMASILLVHCWKVLTLSSNSSGTAFELSAQASNATLQIVVLPSLDFNHSRRASICCWRDRSISD
jgi:hypothetical protein